MNARELLARLVEVDIADLEGEPTLAQGQCSDLKREVEICGMQTRYWLSRCTVEDGETHAVDVEQCFDGRWESVHRYGEPRADKSDD